MDNFDYKKYLKSNRINDEAEKVNIISEDKKQGYDDREDESLGARKGAEKGKKVSMKGRRDDSYGKFGKRDAEAKGKAKGPGKNKINKENVDLNMEEESLEIPTATMTKLNSSVKSAKTAAKSMVDFYNQMSEKETMDFEKNPKMKMALDRLKDLADSKEDAVDEMYGKKYEEDDIKPVSEDARTDAEEEGYEDGFKDAKADMKDALKKMKVSELKAKIRENILAELAESDEVTEAEEDVDVDIDVEDKVEVDAEADDIEIKRPGVKATIDVGLSPEEEVVQDSLKAAMDAASQLGNDKLADQIGNTITFFTREYVVGNRTD